MVKYFAMIATVAGLLLMAGEAQARGRHGCASCGAAAYGGGCPGGVCAVPYGGPGKMAVVTPAPAVSPAPAPAPAVVATPARPTLNTYASYTPARRGIFGWRR